ncbi:MAG: HIT family protein [Chitinophagales bacterium]|nr:HIT family protein [Chitinophagales bacterium]
MAGRKTGLSAEKNEDTPECLFCRIASGLENAHILHEDEFTIAFLDIKPVFAGHTLIVPKIHYELLENIPDHLIKPLFKIARLFSVVMKESLNAQGSFVAMNNKVSQSVPHFHIHVIPRSKGDGLKGFFWPRKKYDDEHQINTVANKIKKVLKCYI